MRTKIKKSDQLYPFIREREEKERKLFRNAPHIKLIANCIVGSLMLFLLSYCARNCHPWLSPLLQSIGVGIVTGLIVYVLGNVRAQQEKHVSSVLKQLADIYRHEVRIYHVIPMKLEMPFCSFGQVINFNWTERVYDALDAVDEYIDALKKLEPSIFRELVAKTKLDFDQMEEKVRLLRDEIPEEISEEYCWQLSRKLIEVIQDSASWIEDKYVEYEILDSQLNKYPL